MAIHEVKVCNNWVDYHREVALMQEMHGSSSSGRGGLLMEQNSNWVLSPPLQEQQGNNLHQQQQVSSSSSSSSPYHFHQLISAHLHRQRMELDHFINLQNEGLRRVLQEQRTHHTAFLVKKYESMARLLLAQKEDEIRKAANRTLELQRSLSNMELENQTWQRAAKENESVIESLRIAIERVKESACMSFNPAAPDTESCCHVTNGEGEEEEEGSCKEKLACRLCKNQRSCVIVLPCRHLCCCAKCEVFLDSCPVCGTIKRGSIEAI